MDARTRRTSVRLRAAALELAEHTPIDDVTVASICARAGVTRDTFYRHAANAVGLLADALASEIAEATEGLPHAELIGDAERALLEHVHRRARVYRGAMHPLLSAPLRDNLDRSIRAGLLLWVELHPEIVPRVFSHDDAALAIAIAYAASGTVGAIEEWLRHGDDDIDRAVKLVLAASPEWWLR
ncbi:TetR/AcrR family transcriptional regulator [Microbacterium sp. 1.5R]|uniref:TetR/AcrR family transcriptional regulator n=1 Tax=Microbacterium sp. 1.5R TaxID=1916917 RepID=UPI0011A53162|nr:TetR/AcrR family transcriptional regulator [Microbacterium sp. 1.5R]